MMTEHHSEMQDHVNTIPNAIEVEEKCRNDSENSLNANTLDQSWTLSDLVIKEEGLDTLEVKKEGTSTSVILHIETPES